VQLLGDRRPGAESITFTSDNFEDHANSRWQTEYREHAKDIATLSPTSVAGIVTISKEDIPTFYAWADEQQSKPVSKLQPTTTIKLAPRHTEYADEYVKKASSPTSRPAAPVVSVSSSKGNIVPTEGGPLDAAASGGVSEYTANYKVPETTGPAAVFSARVRGEVQQQPAQFAWALFDGEKDKPTSTYR
jgi:hypothetical protein